MNKVLGCILFVFMGLVAVITGSLIQVVGRELAFNRSIVAFVSYVPVGLALYYGIKLFTKKDKVVSNTDKTK